MKIYRFDASAGEQVEQIGSENAVVTNITELNGKASVRCIHLDRNGLVGSHQAASNQLFLVVQGDGYLRGEGAIRTPIQAGQAVFWDKGEWHETSTGKGLMAIVIEGEDLQPAESMPEA